MAKTTSIFKKIQSDVRAMLDESMFRPGGEPSRFYKFIHFWVLVCLSYVRNHCLIRASALSYATLLALIPMLALVMSVTTSMLKGQGQERIEQFIGKFVATVVPPGPMETGETNAALSPTNWYIEGP